MNYERCILNELVNRYERRNPAQPSSRAISLDIAKKYPECQEPLSEAQQRMEEALHHLQAWGFVTCTENLQGYYTKITLVEPALPQIYSHLCRTPKADQIQAQRTLLEKTAAHTNGVARRFCLAMLEQLSHRRAIGYGLSKDPSQLEDILLALGKLEQLKEETYLRNFSEMVFHDSKRLQRILSPLTRILRDFGDWVCQKDNILEQYNLIKNPGYIYLKGDWKIWCRGPCISTHCVPGGIAISSNALDSIEQIHVPGGVVISVENLTTYHDTKEDQGAIVYLGGFLNTVRGNFLKRLYQCEPSAKYYHRGDLDPYGFFILENLKEKTQIPFLPLEMDLETLRQCHHAGHYRPLDEADYQAIASPRLAAYQPILHYMAEHNCKVEQECFEAMKLEHPSA